MIPNFIFGLGTGRCGTWTLSRIFALQHDVYSQHEAVPLPWERDDGQLWYQVLNLAINVGYPTIAVTSYVWINYVGLIMGTLINPRFICLQRDKDLVVQSYLKHSPANNHWTDPKSLCWDPNKDVHTKISYQWPKYDLPKAQAIEEYWIRYYSHANYLQDMYPDNFRIFDIDYALNTEHGQRQMLEFAGIKTNYAIATDQRLNALHKPKGEIQEFSHV